MSKTYGNLTLKDGQWRITKLQPHVAIAFKRLFPKVSVTAKDIELLDNDETRCDLHWFMQRYPLEHEHEFDLWSGVDRVAKKQAERERILLPEWKPDGPSGFREGKEPYPYQRKAAEIALRNPGLLLGDDVGLGKTISALCLLTIGAPMPAAIVVQPHLAEQWRDRAEEFTNLKVHIIKGTKPYDLPSADVYIFKYSNVFGWVDIFNTGLFKAVIYDEIQELRTGQASGKGAACKILSDHAEIIMALTATPIYNYGDEMFNIMEFIEPGLLGTKWEFLREWCGGGRKVSDPDALGTYLRDKGFFLRRTEDDEDVQSSLKPLNTIDYEVPWNASAAKGSEELFKTLALTVVSGGFVEAGQAARELDIKMRLVTGVAKAESVAAYIELLLKDAPRVLVAGWHRDVYDIWQKSLAHHNPVLYTGSESPAAKRRSIEAFTQGDSRVMMISLRSGAGLDGLQFYCNDVVMGELDWSPQVHKQVIGRLRRPGQEHEVTAHYLHTAGGSDPVIMDMLGVKADQSRGIIDPMKGVEVKQADDARIRRLAEQVLEAA